MSTISVVYDNGGEGKHSVYMRQGGQVIHLTSLEQMEELIGDMMQMAPFLAKLPVETGYAVAHQPTKPAVYSITANMSGLSLDDEDDA